MNKFLSILTAGALVAGIGLATATPSMADPAGDAAAGAIIGGTLGFMAGAAAANGGGDGFYVRRHHFRDWQWRRHVADCQDEYGWRYDPSTDLVRMHGRRFYCDL
jgi:hypothetical protein